MAGYGWIGEKMNIEIKHCFTNNVLFSCDAKNLKAAVEKAVKEGASLYGASLDGASLDGASLSGANLSGANLDGASLDGASLDGANLDGASLDGEIITIAPVSISGLTWSVLISESYMSIGCQRHTHAEWDTFSDDKIRGMEPRAESFWSANKQWLLTACAAHKAESIAYRGNNPEKVSA